MLVTPSFAIRSPYIPFNSSPLSPRSANVNATISPFQSVFFGMTGSENESTLDTKSSTYARRQIKPTPFSGRTRDEQRDRRRDLFLKRVDQTRDDKRWEGRSEEILRCDHFAQQRRWKEAHESQPEPDLDTLVAENEGPSLTSSIPYEPTPTSTSTLSEFQIYSDAPVDEVDAVAEQEQLEMQEWAEFLAQSNFTQQQPRPAYQYEQQDNTSQMTDYDDDEYDSVFMELIDQQPTAQQPRLEDTDMDLSS